MVKSNGMKNYQRYQSRQVRGLVEQIPHERRKDLLKLITGLAQLNGIANENAYRLALKHLKETS